MFGFRDNIFPAAIAAGAYGAFKVCTTYEAFFSGSSSSSGGFWSGVYCTVEDGRVYLGDEDQVCQRPGFGSCFEIGKNGLIGNIWSERKHLSWWQGLWVKEIHGWVYPGFWDGHGHITQYGMMEAGVKAYDQTIPEILSSILSYLEKNPSHGSPEKWILGTGWDQAYFEGTMPTAEALTSLPHLVGKYIALYRVDVHCIWVSPAVLQLLPDPLPPTPPGGSIPSNGVFCDNAMDQFIIPLIPEITESDIEGYINTTVPLLHSLGIVGVMDAATSMKEVPVYKRLAEEGKLGLRVYGMVECPKRNTFCEVEKVQVVDNDGAFILRAAKIFADGALGSWGAALLEPYSDKPTRGSMLINETELATVVSQWYAADWHVAVHAIGDRANRAALDAFDAAIKLHPEINTEQKFRVEHAQIIHPDDQARFLDNSIIPSIQPTHATSDMAYALDRLGSERLANSAYRMNTLFPPFEYEPHYVFPIFGSDFPVEPASPIEGIYAAVTRCNPKSKSCNQDEVWKKERIGRLRSVQGFLRNVGWGSGLVNYGYGIGQMWGWADWVILDSNLFDETVDLREVKVEETWIGGKMVWKREPKPEPDFEKAAGMIKEQN